MYGDELRLKQVLINLVKNALKFTIGGRVKLVAAYDETDEKLFVQVVDSGKGFCQSDASKLFTKFGKLKRTAEMNNEGIGLGLLICQNIVRASGGTISAHSEGLDKGATFSFSIKMCLSEQVNVS